MVSVQAGNTKTMWRIGFTIFILSNLLGSTVQIAALPLTVLAPLHASGLVYNAILASLLLGEPFTYLSMAGTILVAIGATLIALFGAISEPSHSLAQLLNLFAAPRFLGWMSFQLVLALAIILAVSLVSRSRAGKTERSRTVQGASLGCLAGLMASHCLLLAKLTVELLVKTFGDHENQFTRWQAWIIPIGLGVGALTQLYYLNRGLRMCTTSMLYPLNFSVYNITTIIDGLIYYKQGAQLTKLQIGMVVLGILLLLLGVAGLSWKLTNDKEDVGLQVTIPGGGVYDVVVVPASPTMTTTMTPKSPREMSRDEEHEVWGVLSDEFHHDHHNHGRHRRTSSKRTLHRGDYGDDGRDSDDEEDDERTSLLRLGTGRNRAASPPHSRFQSFRQVLGRYSFVRGHQPDQSHGRQDVSS